MIGLIKLIIYIFMLLQINKRFVTSYLNVQGKLYTKIGYVFLKRKKSISM